MAPETGSSSLAHSYRAIPFAFPVVIELGGFGALSDALVCRRRHDKYTVVSEKKPLLTGANEGFCEDLARQNTVAHLSQLQLRFRRRHRWVSMLSHMGFSRRRGVLKATI
jgi:hypothetical protein